jgi:sucrose phosphorylase
MDFEKKIAQHLSVIYPTANTRDIGKAIVYKARSIKSRIKPLHKKWSEQDIILITYGDSIREKSGSPLDALHKFLVNYLDNLFSIVHILPFTPYSSDDGFSVIDYRKVNPDLGTWEDIQTLAKQSRVMGDLVINHVSSKSEWFQNFLLGKSPGFDFFIEIDPSQDLSAVVRPRSLPLLTKFKTKYGDKYLWTTFSADQIDLNFRNPSLLLEMIDIVLEYILRGISVIRLDAIAFLFKKPGTSCVHLPETHEFVKLLRTILQFIDASILLITETNVPNRENLSYFGANDEAHLVYNFSLPPLLLHCLFTSDSTYINNWASEIPELSDQNTFLNFTASHDGIGVRPLEGILPKEQFEQLIEGIKKSGGLISTRRTTDGKDIPYELNITYFDALKQTIDGSDDFQVERFLCSQTVLLSMKGIPALYINSLLGASNYTEGIELSGMSRTINRQKWNLDDLIEKLNGDSSQSKVFKSLKELIRIRKNIPEFHPDANQQIITDNRFLFVIKRDYGKLISVSNITKHEQIIDKKGLFGGKTELNDLISNTRFTELEVLKPYQTIWVRIE